MHQRQRAEDVLGQMQIQSAQEFFAADNSPTAIAYLARVLRRDPTNRVAGERLISALTQRNFALPAVEPFKHESYVWSARFSPDGQRLVTCSEDGTVRVWAARTGQPLTEPLRHGARVWSAQFSPDGQRVVTASDDTTARVWDADTGEPLTDPLKHGASVHSAQFSPDGQRVATACWDGAAQVWDARTGQPLASPLNMEQRWQPWSPLSLVQMGRT